MEAVKSLIIACVALVFAVVMQILVMINGWGMEPKSYFWIIGIGLGSSFMTQIFVEIAKHTGERK